METHRPLYQRAWSPATPGCLVFIIDQSAAMAEQLGSGLVGAGSRKCDALAMVINNVLKDLIERSRRGSYVRPTCAISLLGYSDDHVYSAFSAQLAGRLIIPITEVADHPNRINIVSYNEYDPETGSMVQTLGEIPIWVEPAAQGNRPLCAALNAAQLILRDWLARHDDSFPPVVINISTGAATDGDPISFAARLKLLRTIDGATLLFNCLISSTLGYQVKYPDDLSQVPADPLAQMLFKMSSVLPEPMLAFANSSYNMNLNAGARGFIFGGDVYDFTAFIRVT